MGGTPIVPKKGFDSTVSGGKAQGSGDAKKRIADGRDQAAGDMHGAVASAGSATEHTVDAVQAAGQLWGPSTKDIVVISDNYRLS